MEPVAVERYKAGSRSIERVRAIDSPPSSTDDKEESSKVDSTADVGRDGAAAELESAFSSKFTSSVKLKNGERDKEKNFKVKICEDLNLSYKIDMK